MSITQPLSNRPVVRAYGGFTPPTTILSVPDGPGPEVAAEAVVGESKPADASVPVEAVADAAPAGGESEATEPGGETPPKATKKK